MAEELRFADWLIATGRAMGYATYTSLAQALGVPQPTVSRWKAGAKPSVEHLVRISELFGIELKTLLVLSGHMKGDVSSEQLGPPPSEADRMINESGLEEAFKEVLRNFWRERMREERSRLQSLIQGTDHAVSPSGGIRATELEPWLEKAGESSLARHVQRFQNALAEAPKPYTWFVANRFESEPLSSAPKRFLRTVKAGGMVEARVVREGAAGGFFPLISCPDGGWDALTENLETAEEAEGAIRDFFGNYPTLTFKEVRQVDAAEEEGPS